LLSEGCYLHAGAEKVEEPGYKLQRNPKQQPPCGIPFRHEEPAVGAWSLEFFWSLVLGVWTFVQECIMPN
jgi:hypothetical protein